MRSSWPNRLCDDVEFSPEDATRTDPDFLCRVLDAVVEAGATTLNIPDTVGYTVPTEFAELITMIRRCVTGYREVTIAAHCHNDLGMAVANALAAVSRERDRWNARSMVLASAQGTPRWKRL